MDVQELIKHEYKAIFGLEINYGLDHGSYKLLTKSCNRNKINQNSIELYQAEQKLKASVNYPYLSSDNYSTNLIGSYLPDMSNGYLFKTMKKDLLVKSKSNKKSDKYKSNILEKYKLLMLQAVEDENKEKIMVLYYAAKLLDKKFIIPEKVFKFIIQEES